MIWLLTFFTALGFSNTERIEYRYQVLSGSGIKKKCTHENKEQLSRIKLFLERPSFSPLNHLTSVRMRLRICTAFGYVKYSPRLIMPVNLLAFLPYGFDGFAADFDPELITQPEDQTLSILTLQPIKTSKYDGMSLPKNTLWLKLQWTNTQGQTGKFGPMLLGLKEPAHLKAKNFEPESHLPLQFVFVKARGTWIKSELNKIKD